MTVLAFDLGKNTAWCLAESSERPRVLFCDCVRFEDWAYGATWGGHHTAEFAGYVWGLCEAYGACDADLVVWEATWLRPTKKAARIHPGSLQPMQRMSEALAWQCGRHGIPCEAIDVQAMNAKTDFRKMTTANMAVCVRMADALLDGLGEVLPSYLGPRGGMGTAGHLWDAARLARHALTGLRLEGVA